MKSYTVTSYDCFKNSILIVQTSHIKRLNVLTLSLMLKHLKDLNLTWVWVT